MLIFFKVYDIYSENKNCNTPVEITIMTMQGPPMAGTNNKIVSTKRKKGGKNGQGRDGQGSAGELLVIPFLSKFVFPPDGSSAITDIIMK